MPNPIATQDSASPFDAIRDQDGTWSARKLMVLMGYTTWRNFTVPLGRAMKSAEVQGHDVASNFAGSRKVSASGPDADDYALSRFAAYLVAMNGDPNKLEVAQAQAYFATKTREAEVQAAPALPRDYASALRELASSVEACAALEAKVEQDAPKVAQVDTLRLSDGLVTISDLAVLLKTHAVANFPGVKIKRDDVFDLAGIVGLIIRGNTVRHNQPTAKAVEARWVKPADHTYDTNNHGQRTNYYARLTHRGAGRLWDAAIHNLNTYCAVLAPKPGVHS